MATISKQDIVAPRTAADIDRKYNFGKSFAEVAGIATDARKTAEKAEKAVENLDTELSADEIFNRLTNNGQEQGIFREDGKIYINAEYINFDELNGKSLTLTGKLTCTTNAYLPPGAEEIELIDAVLMGMELPAAAIPLYDFDGDGQITTTDSVLAEGYMKGTIKMSNWSGAVATPITMTVDMTNPEKAITFSGKNMWGRDVSGYVGINGTTFPHIGSADYVVEQGVKITDGGAWNYRKWNSGFAEAWLRSSSTTAVTTACGNNMYRTGYILHSFPDGIFDRVIHANVSAIVWDTVGMPHTEIVQLDNNAGQMQWFLYRFTSSDSYSFDYSVEMNGYWK